MLKEAFIINNLSNQTDIWNAKLYDQNHSFVSHFGSSLFELLQPKTREKILDLGCGTGDLTSQLVNFGVDVLGIDKSANMIEEAKKKFPSIIFKTENATDFCYENTFDAIFSNAVLHWIKTPEAVLQNCYKSLKRGGRFVVEFGGKGNVQIISNEIISQIIISGYTFSSDQFPWYFPSIGEYTSLMEKEGFRVTFAEHYDRPTPLVGKDGLKNWIKMFGNSFFEGIADEKKEAIITKIEANLSPVLMKKNTWTADYKRLRVIGIKE